MQRHNNVRVREAKCNNLSLQNRLDPQALKRNIIHKINSPFLLAEDLKKKTFLYLESSKNVNFCVGLSLAGGIFYEVALPGSFFQTPDPTNI